MQVGINCSCFTVGKLIKQQGANISTSWIGDGFITDGKGIMYFISNAEGQTQQPIYFFSNFA
jgi:hypothetical protein